jgi:MFS transporter, AAHS family, 4-hydroxybenzoate transporter
MKNNDVLLDDSNATKLQITTILICFLMNILDGMDVMVVSYSASAISKEWDISAQALGGVFSAGLVGMTFGSIFIAPRADIVGRRAIILLSALLMGVLVFVTSFAQSISQLVFLRFVSGLGIGSMLASTTTLTSEYAPQKTKDFWVSFVLAGYPMGAVLSGLVAAKIIPAEGWRVMFQIAGIATLVTLPLIYFVLAESLDFLLKSQPAGALQKINAILSKMNLPALGHLPVISNESVEKVAVTSLLTPQRKAPTIYLWLALFMAFGSMYFLLTWLPKLASSAGLSVELAIYAGAVFNLGAVFGIITQGYYSTQFGLRRTISIFLVVTAIFLAIFGFFVGTYMVLVLVGLIGFGIQGGFVGMYAIAARFYPTEIRSTGIGWSMSMGRIGGIVGPACGGFLVAIGLSIGTNFLIFAIPTLLAGIATMLISTKEIR